MFILSGESKFVEYKREYSNTILKTVCAFANYHDGHIIIGIGDDLTVLGVSNISEVRINVENAINDTIIPRPYYEFEVIKKQEKKLLVLRIYKGEFTPYVIRNKAYMRRDTSTVQVDRESYESLILDGRNQGFEDLISLPQDLTFTVLENRLKEQFEISNLSEDLLKTLGLLKNNSFNKAAALLSDKNPVNSSVVQLIAFADSNVGRIKDRKILNNASILEQFDACISFYDKHINTGEVIEGAYRKTIEEVPLIAYREAVANMLVHRDYSKSIDARIEFFSDRVEIVSPGGLPIGLMTEEYLEGKISKARNKKISDIFLRLKIIEKLATGVRRIKQEYSSYEVCPKFKVSDNAVVVVLPKVGGQTSAVGMIKEEQADLLSAKESLVYGLIENKPNIKRVEIQKYIHLEKSQTIEVINRLRALGLIYKSGNGPATGYTVVK